MSTVSINIGDLSSQDRVTESLGSVNPNQLGAVLSQQSKAVASANNLSIEEMTNRIVSTSDNTAEGIMGYGIGKYAITPQALEDNGYIKPGTTQRFLNDPSTLESVLRSPSVWTGKEGITSVNTMLGNSELQSTIQTDIMNNSLSNLKSSGVITGSEDSATVASMVSVASKFGINSTKDWIDGKIPGSQEAAMNMAGSGGSYAVNFVNKKLLPDSNSLLPSNGANGLVAGLGDTLNNVASDIGNFTGNTLNFDDIDLGDVGFGDLSGKLGDITGGFGKALSQIGSDLKGFIDNVGDLQNQISGGFEFGGDILGDITGSVSGSIREIAGSSGGISSITDSTGKLIGGSTGALSSALSSVVGNNSNNLISGLFGGSGSFPAIVKPPVVTQTVNRADIDDAVSKLIGNSKIAPPNYTGIVNASNFQLPSFGLPISEFDFDQPVEVCSCSDPTLIGPTKSECEAAGGEWTCYTVNNRGIV